MWLPESRRRINRLGDYWNSLASGASADRNLDAEQLDIELRDTIDQVRSLHRRRRPDPVFAANLERTLMNAFVTTPADLAATPKSRNTTAWVPPGQTRRSRSAPVRPSWIAIGVTAIALTLFLLYTLWPSGDQPVIIAPDTTETPAATSVATPEATAPAVTMYRGNNERTGEMPGPAPSGVPGVLWRVQANDQVASAVTVANGIAYVGSNDGVVRAIDIATGDEIWTVETAANAESPFSIVDGSTVFVAGGDGTVRGLDAATGSEIWRSDPVLDISNQITLDDESVYVAGHGTVYYALSKEDGSVRWTTNLSGAAQSRGAVLLDGAIYFGADDGKTYSLDAATGAIKWSLDSGLPVVKTVASVDGVIFVPAVNDETLESALIAIDAETGTELWRYAVTTGGLSAGTPYEDLVLVGTNNGELLALDRATGILDWKVATGSQMAIGAGPSIVDGVAYFGSNDSSLYAVDLSTQSPTWSVALDGEMNMSPAIIGGVIYVGTWNGSIYALGDDGAPISAPGTPEASSVAIASASLAPNLQGTPTPEFAATMLWKVDAAAPGLVRPGPVSIAPDGKIWVADGSSTFKIFAPDGTFVESWGVAGSNNGEFNLCRPNGDTFGSVLFNSDGSFFVFDAGNHRIQAFDKDRGFVQTFGILGDGPGEFGEMLAVVFDPTGNLAVLDDSRGEIQTFSQSGEFLSSVSLESDESGVQGMNSMAIDGQGNVYVSYGEPNRIVKYDPSGKIVMTIAPVTGRGRFGDYALYLGIDAAGNIYSGEYEHNPRIVVFTPDGEYLAEFGTFSEGDASFMVPWGFTLDHSGNIYVADFVAHKLMKFQLNPPLWPLDTAATPTT